jgi:uncharacterized membrane protein
MSRENYLENLSRKLRALPESERNDALEYYDGYISDAEDESAAIAQLGSPGEVAANILANYVQSGNSQKSSVEKVFEKRNESYFSGVKLTWLIIIALFAVPIGFPIIIAVAAVAFALFVTLCSLVFAVGVTGIALLATGIGGLIAVPFLIFQDFSYAVFLLGMGLLSLGAGIFLMKLTAVLMRGFPKISHFVSKKIVRRRNGNEE